MGPVRTSFPSLSRLDKTFNYAVKGRGVAIVVYVESYNAKTDIHVREEDIFTPVLKRVLEAQGIDEVSEKRAEDFAFFQALHSNDISALNRLKQETGATDVLTCKVVCRTTGVPQTLFDSTMQYFFGDVQLKIHAGPDNMMVYEYQIVEDTDTKLGLPMNLVNRAVERCLSQTAEVLEARLKEEAIAEALQ